MTLTAAPVLETERLTLCGPETRDTEAVIAFLLDKARAEFFGHCDTRADAWRWFALMVGHWHIHGYGYFIIADKETDKAVGLCGVWNPEGWPEPEIGWVVFEGSEGKGIAYEAATRVRQYAYRDLGLTTITSNIVPGNTRSIKLAERLGATYERTYQNV
ncbi:GNAT family N-acetyltransferase, partial [Yoonia sp.]|uniref:GNAT family N-acetyltransferase n=1 Tax=Yoonia sp. TaxID=2212373 RepID=UPI0035C792EC